MSAIQKRRRSKVACDTCRSFKRKCDSAQPCSPCIRFSMSVPISRDHLGAAKPARAVETPTSGVHRHLCSLEANSGAAFARKLALKIDPKNAPRMHLFAWNPFLGSRDGARPSISVYFDKVDPVYGFVNREELALQVHHRWRNLDLQNEYDCILHGVAALGCLFSQVDVSSLERICAQTARTMLERALSSNPTVASITAWALRVTYLRITGRPHAAWMASCLLMHMVEAGVALRAFKESVLPLAGDDIDPEIRRRLFGDHPAQCVHHGPSTRPGDQTVELLELLPYAEILDPGQAPETSELEATLDTVLGLTYSIPPTKLARCNLVLCICRRLKSLNISFTAPVLERILSVTLEGIQAARTLLDQRAPWHHMANIPFQIVCILLAIDTNDALHGWGDSESIPGTERWQCRRGLGAPQLEDIGWLSGLAAEIPSLQDIDIDQFLNQSLYWDMSNQNH
ncbi:unnamed protein product [Parascedosporium putredinis]|uniref:Zn(2)-C6 fungal-type domain-containing protein n=1 Tax=Parascedosporium putredinis TaxID=1442378 RepID=A0A9P1H815_9PEZI|nr:unnamed protein product [Parascedosporium putredinis]CAI8000205.1 unnamed protein product [Parascedosporium putredinis]